MNMMRKKISVQVVLIGLAVFLSLTLAPIVYATTSITVTPSNPQASEPSNYTINFRLPDAAASTTEMSFTFPAGFGVTGAGPSAISVTGMDEQFDLTVDGQTVKLATTTEGSATSTTDTQTVTITGLYNTTQDGSYTVSMAATTTDGAKTGTSAAFAINKTISPAPQDTTAPVSSIINPVSGAVIPAGQSYTIEGTSTDNASVVSKVEVSLDGGTTWVQAQSSSVGTSGSWSYVWTNPADGEYTIRVRATDSAGNVESPGPSVAVTVGAGVPVEEEEEVVPETPVTETTVSQLQAKLTELRQTLLGLLQQLVSLLQQQLQTLTGGN